MGLQKGPQNAPGSDAGQGLVGSEGAILSKNRNESHFR